MMQQLKQEPLFESGKVILKAGDLRLLEVSLTSKTVDVNIVDKELIKRALSLTDIMTPLQPASPKEFEGKKTEGDLLKTVRTVAETLKDRGITLTVSFKGDRLVTIGAGANSTLLQFVTKTKAIAINNIVKLAQMIS